MSDIFAPIREVKRLCLLHPELKPDDSKYSATARISPHRKIMVDPGRRPIEWVVIDLVRGEAASVFDVDLTEDEMAVVKMYADSLKSIRAEAV